MGEEWGVELSSGGVGEGAGKGMGKEWGKE